MCSHLKTKIQWFESIVLKGYGFVPLSSKHQVMTYSTRGLFMDLTVGKIEHRQGGYSDITACVTPDAGHVGRKSMNHSPVLRPSLPGQWGSVKPKESIGGNLLGQKCRGVAPPDCAVVTQPEGSVIWTGHSLRAVGRVLV